MASKVPPTTYAVVIAHREGMAVERLLSSTESATMAEAQAHADAWTRRHGHRALDTDKCGFYAYADRATRPMGSYRVRVK